MVKSKEKEEYGGRMYLRGDKKTTDGIELDSKFHRNQKRGKVTDIWKKVKAGLERKLGKLDVKEELLREELFLGRLVGDDLDSGELDVSLDLESGDVVWIDTMSIRSESLSVDEDLESELFVSNLQIESSETFEWILSLAFLISPFSVDKRVTDDTSRGRLSAHKSVCLLVETWIEVKSNVSVLLQKIDVELLGLLLRSSVDNKSLSWNQTVGGDSTLVWDWIVLSSPLNMVEDDISVDGQVGDRVEWNTVLEVLDLLMVDRNLELLVMGTDADVEVLSLLDWVLGTLFLAPGSLGVCVVDDLSLVETDGEMKWNIVTGEVRRVLMEIDVESLRLVDGFSSNNESLSGLDALG